jgi:hypothetical protein
MRAAENIRGLSRAGGSQQADIETPVPDRSGRYYSYNGDELPW